MKIGLKRKTSFLGNDKLLKLIKNGQEYTTLAHNEHKELEVKEESMTLSAQLGFLKSEDHTFSKEDDGKEYTVKVNPNILRMYVTFFTFIFIFPLLFKSWVLGVVILLAYIAFVGVMSRKFYTIEELASGEER